MFLTVFGQKGCGKNLHQLHLAYVWAQQGHSVWLADADRTRSANAYAARGMLPLEVITTDGQASSHVDELKTSLQVATLRCCRPRRRPDRLSSRLNSPQFCAKWVPPMLACW